MNAELPVTIYARLTLRLPSGITGIRYSESHSRSLGCANPFQDPSRNILPQSYYKTMTRHDYKVPRPKETGTEEIPKYATVLQSRSLALCRTIATV